MHNTTEVPVLIYSDRDARNWLSIHSCPVTPTTLGNMEIQFSSQQAKVEFFLRFPQYVIRS